MRPLPDPASGKFEILVADCIRLRLKRHGPPPWSICEACLSDEDFQRLCKWAEAVPRWKLKGGDARVGLVLLALFAEWNRRNSPGDSVFPDLPLLLHDEEARQTLFTSNNNATRFLRCLLRKTCEQFQLRHAFGAEQEEYFPYYLSIQLQYGFSLPHARAQLGQWLGGHPPPKVALLLLDEEGRYRSASFLRLVRDMKSYRRRYLAESDFRRSLKENPWVLPTWKDEIVALIDGIPKDGDDDEPEFRLLSDPRVKWVDGPEASCRVCDLPPRLTAPRYLLRCGGRGSNGRCRDRSGAIESDRPRARIPLDRPEAVVTLETPDGRTVETQTIQLWDPEAVAQTRPVNRKAKNAVERLQDGEQVLITSTSAIVTPEPAAWRVMSPAGRRWWLLDGGQRVRVEDDGIVWNGEPPPPPPAWTNHVTVNLATAGTFYHVGDRICFRLHVPAGVEIAHACCAGQPLSFIDGSRKRTSPVPARAEMDGKCRLRVGVTRGHDFALVHREVDLPIRAVVWADDGCEIPRDEPLTCFEAMRRPARLLSDGPTVLIEGREIRGALPIGRNARIKKRVLGTGRGLIVAERPFNTLNDHFPMARSAVDTGFARSLEREGENFRLRLFLARPPSDRLRLFLWSPTHGTTILSASEISAEDDGRAWGFRAPWETETLLAAIVSEGTNVAAAWMGDERCFYDLTEAGGSDALARIALVRWCRLPALRPDPDAPGHALIYRLACRPLEMTRVALLNEGLPEGLELTFDDRSSPRGELFNVIFREVYIRPTEGDLAAVFEGLSPEDFNRLMTYHPLLGCRALEVALRRYVASNPGLAKKLIEAIRLQVLSLTGSPDAQTYARREAELLKRALTTFSENGEPMDEFAVRGGLVRPVMDHLFKNALLESGHEDNLRTALGVASFREHLAAMILRRMHEQPNRPSEPTPCPRILTR